LHFPYKVFPISKPEPGFRNEKESWVPVLNVSLIIGHSPTRKFEAIVDSGSPSCLFHADIGKAHGLKVEEGDEGPLGGVIGGAKGLVYYHRVKLAVASQIMPSLPGSPLSYPSRQFSEGTVFSSISRLFSIRPAILQG